jgi:hypothetical protein
MFKWNFPEVLRDSAARHLGDAALLYTHLDNVAIIVRGKAKFLLFWTK